MRRAELRLRKERSEFDAAYREYSARTGHHLWEMGPREMLLGRWGTTPDEDLVVLEPGRFRQPLRRQGIRFPIAKATWTAIVNAHAGCCIYCGKVPDSLHLDHITPVSRGGCTEPSNLVPACQGCNSSKGALPLSVWLKRRPDLNPEAIVGRWDEAQRRGRHLVEECS